MFHHRCLNLQPKLINKLTMKYLYLIRYTCKEYIIISE